MDTPNNTPDAAPDEGNKFYIPAESCPDCEIGDTIQLKVTGKTADGELEVQPIESANGENWKSDLKKHMASDEPAQGDDSYGQ